MAKATQIFEAVAWFCDGLPAGDVYSRETAQKNCKAGIGRASTKHRVLFGPLRWSELKAGDAQVTTTTPPPFGACWLRYRCEPGATPADVTVATVRLTAAAVERTRSFSCRAGAKRIPPSPRCRVFSHDAVCSSD